MADSASSLTNAQVNENDILQLYASIALWEPGKSNLSSKLYIGRHSCL